MLKILVIGNSYSGKTSLVNRFVSGKFETSYKTTVACDYQMKPLKIQEQEIRIFLWDMVGQDPRVGAINKLYCRGALGAVVVCDISDKKSMDATLEWKEQLDQVV